MRSVQIPFPMRGVIFMSACAKSYRIKWLVIFRVVVLLFLSLGLSGWFFFRDLGNALVTPLESEHCIFLSTLKDRRAGPFRGCTFGVDGLECRVKNPQTNHINKRW